MNTVLRSVTHAKGLLLQCLLTRRLLHEAVALCLPFPGITSTLALGTSLVRSIFKHDEPERNSSLLQHRALTEGSMMERGSSLGASDLVRPDPSRSWQILSVRTHGTDLALSCLVRGKRAFSVLPTMVVLASQNFPFKFQPHLNMEPTSLSGQSKWGAGVVVLAYGACSAIRAWKAAAICLCRVREE